MAEMSDDPSLTEVLSEFIRTMLTDFPIQGMLDQLVGRAVHLLPITSAGVTLITDDNAPRSISASDDAALGFDQLQTELGQGPSLAAYFGGEPVLAADLAAEQRFAKFASRARGDGLGAAFAFPMGYDNHQIGTLNLYRDRPGHLDDTEVKTAQTLADVAAAFLLNAQIRHDLLLSSAKALEDALHDPLTSLPNRRLMFERLNKAAERPRAVGQALAVFFVDLDGFKLVNDVHGHRAGDELLVAVAGRLNGLLRQRDTVARISGDEFVVLFDDLDGRQEVEAVADRVLGALSGRFMLAECAVNISASIGIAVLPSHDVSMEELLHIADEAMYEAKRAGGGRYRIAELPG
jgi:diguanylate cyclase (GGDEF)-like protein